MKFKLANLQENIPLAQHTTFRIGGPAKYFLVAKNEKDFVGAIRAAKENSLPFYVIGGGSNLLVSDEGFDGLIIKSNFSRFDKRKDGKVLRASVDAGTSFGQIVVETARAGFSGMEWGFGIPGTIGGAIFGNAGRLGQATAQVVKKVKILDENLNERIAAAEECGFAYRESWFKKNSEIILSADLEFEAKDQKTIDEVLNEARQVVLNSPKFPSAGCAFKNYVVGDGVSAADPLLTEHPELKDRVRGGKIGVGYLIDQCGLKGRQIGGAKIWEGHANYVINTGEAKAKDVWAIVELCKQEVLKKYGIMLEEEIRYLK